MRPGCDRPAEARLSYDTIGCQVWLDALADRPGRSQEICDLHATRLTVPRGWMLCDRRVDEPALFVATTAGATATAATLPSAPTPTARPSGRPGRRRRSGERTRHPAATLELFESPGAEPAPEPPSRIETQVDAVQRVEAVEVVEPVPEVEPTPVDEPAPDDDVPESLRATSPLLARAFAATGHQRSVLTQRRSEPDPD